MLERVLVCLLSGGHLLIEGVPGLAKTLTIKTAAAALGGTFHRIQFTPDLVPSDLVGTRVFRPDTGTFDTEQGPVFCNFLLADEINRAPAKVQSALLEVMQEHQVTIGRETMPVPDPFLVMATQNPIESEGTYPLPEAQVDRFMLKVVVGYPEPEDELTVVERALEPVRRGAGRRHRSTNSRRCARRCTRVYVDPAVSRYAVALAGATRSPEAAGIPELGRYVEFGASPRGSISLVVAARALALIRGRDYVLPQDLVDLAHDVLRHRLVLSYEAIATGVAEDTLIDAALAAVPVPRARGRGACRMTPTLPDIERTREKPGPGPVPAGLLRALDLRVARRTASLVDGEHRASAPRPRLRARSGAALRRGRRRPAHRLERHRAPQRAARARRRRRARRLDAGSCSTSPRRWGSARATTQGGRRRGRRARARAHHVPPRQPGRRADVRRRAAR